jgi:hypothetical protein
LGLGAWGLGLGAWGLGLGAWGLGLGVSQFETEIKAETDVREIRSVSRCHFSFFLKKRQGEKNIE